MGDFDGITEEYYCTDAQLVGGSGDGDAGIGRFEAAVAAGKDYGDVPEECGASVKGRPSFG